MTYLDPFGAPEFWIDGVAEREIACAGVMRLVFFAKEHGDRIAKVKLLVPVSIILTEQRKTITFITDAKNCGHVLM